MLPIVITSDQACKKPFIDVCQLPRSESLNMLVHRYIAQLDKFICAYMSGANSALNNSQQYHRTQVNIYTERGAMAAARWTFGIALSLVSAVGSAPEDRSPGSIGATQSKPASSAAAYCRNVISNCQHVYSAIAGLPSELRFTLLLVAAGELSFERAGILLTLPVSVVRERLARLLRQGRPQNKHLEMNRLSDTMTS